MGGYECPDPTVNRTPAGVGPSDEGRVSAGYPTHTSHVSHPSWRFARSPSPTTSGRNSVIVHLAYSAPNRDCGIKLYQTVDDTGNASVEYRTGDVDEGRCWNCDCSTTSAIVRVPLYREPNIWSISQFCVSPEYKGMGYGRRLHEEALSFASDAGAEFVALDTAEPAQGLIAMYESWGYAVVGTCDWRPHTNYRSVLMKRSVASEGRFGP